MLTILLVTVSFGQTGRDLVKGNLIQFNDDGGRCWYQDERVVVDIATGNILLGSDGSGIGVGGSPRSGDVEAVLFDLRTRTTWSWTPITQKSVRDNLRPVVPVWDNNNTAS